MLLVAVGLFTYARWQVYRKRRAQEYISIGERRRLHNMMMAALIMLFGALIGLVTALPTVSAYPF